MTSQLSIPNLQVPLTNDFRRQPCDIDNNWKRKFIASPSSSPPISPCLSYAPRSRQVSPSSIISNIPPSTATTNENIAPRSQRSFPPGLQSSPIEHTPTRRKVQQQDRIPTDSRPVSVPSQASILADGVRLEDSERHPANPTSPSLAQALPVVRNGAKQGGIECFHQSNVDTIFRDAKQVDVDTVKARPGDRKRLRRGPESIETYATNETLPADRTIEITPRRRFATTSSCAEQTSVFPQRTFGGHRKHLSLASSGIVHTLRTASFSNASFSMLSRSFRLGHSSDTSGIHGSRQRFSVDSDRPSTSTSIDEAAHRRSNKRKQILEELVTTEESYVDDLKALVYLVSTLLASASTVSKGTKSAILQNVLEILHLHEDIVERLHKALFSMAARKWADIISPGRLTSPRHVRWRSMELTTISRIGPKYRKQRSYSDSTNGHPTRARLGASDPADVSTIMMIFRPLIPRFLAYEEYCANHEVVTHELQKQMPEVRSTYESGLESLARFIVSLDRRPQIQNRAVTVGDLLIKPIQRICKYPLLFADLLKSTPVVDCPTAHAEVETILGCLHDIIQAVDTATHSHEARSHIQRRWSLQSKLDFSLVSMHVDDFRSLGYVTLCGVLHVCYHAKSGIDGTYGLCILFDDHLVVAVAAGASIGFEVVAIIRLVDLQIESASNGIGLQCPSTLYTWKICFAVNGQLHELILSACSEIEEEQWKIGLRGRFRAKNSIKSAVNSTRSNIAFDLRSVGALYGNNDSLTRRASVQRAATVGNKAGFSQVIIRNTFNHQDLQGYRQDSTSAIGRSQSHMTPRRTTILAPKRSERTRLEALVEEVWTKDKLPFPGMIASRSTQIIRASAGSLVRKLSLASMHGPFSRRSGSLSLSSKRSVDALSDSKQLKQILDGSKFEIRRNSSEEVSQPKVLKAAHDIPELDTMDRVIHRMIGDQRQEHKKQTPSGREGLWRKASSRRKTTTPSMLPIGPDDPADVFYAEDVEMQEQDIAVEETAREKRKKRWSNPVGLLKGFSAESIRNMLQSSK